MINIQLDRLIVNDHCYDYFELTEAEILHAVTRATEGFTTEGGNKSPTVFGMVGFERYGFVIADDEVITILPEHEAERNANNRNSLKSILTTVEVY